MDTIGIFGTQMFCAVCKRDEYSTKFGYPSTGIGNPVSRVTAKNRNLIIRAFNLTELDVVIGDPICNSCYLDFNRKKNTKATLNDSDEDSSYDDEKERKSVKRKRSTSPTTVSKKRKFNVDTLYCSVCYKKSPQVRFNFPSSKNAFLYSVNSKNYKKVKNFFKLDELEEGPMCIDCRRLMNSRRKNEFLIKKIRNERLNPKKIYTCTNCKKNSNEVEFGNTQVTDANRKRLAEYFGKDLKNGYLCGNCFADYYFGFYETLHVPEKYVNFIKRTTPH